jgi:hypothetical protein
VATRTPTLPPSLTFTPTQTPTITPTATDTLTPSVTPTLEPTDHYWLARPIARNKTDWVDRTYPYGGAQYDTRQVHTGVEFVNPRFTPVLAAADGVVLYAGSDTEILFGPAHDFYGNLIVLAHDIVTPEGMPVYTLYGHLERIEVETGQSVRRGEKIAAVGDSGVAIGPHLHFEIRVDDPMDYGATRNPEMWIRPFPGFGTLAGYVTEVNGAAAFGVTLLVRSTEISREVYTYGDDTVNSDAVWHENFALGDLPEDRYEIIVSEANGRVRFREEVLIEAGRTTWIDVQLKR